MQDPSRVQMDVCVRMYSDSHQTATVLSAKPINPLHFLVPIQSKISIIYRINLPNSLIHHIFDNELKYSLYLRTYIYYVGLISKHLT